MPQRVRGAIKKARERLEQSEGFLSSESQDGIAMALVSSASALAEIVAQIENLVQINAAARGIEIALTVEVAALAVG